MLRRTLIPSALIAALCLLAAPPVAAQSAPAACGAVRADTLGGIVYANIDLDGPASGLGRGLSREFLDLVLQNIAAGVVDTVALAPMYSAPAEVVVMTYKASTTKEVREPIAPVWSGHPELTAVVTFVMRRGGELTDVRVRSRGDSAVAAMLVRALAEAGARDGRPTIPADVPADAIPFAIRLSLSPDHGAAASQPLAPARQIVREGSPPTPREGNDAPKFPESQRVAGAPAVLVVWFDVDERGRVVRESFGAAPPMDASRAGAYRTFVAAVERAAWGWRFSPAMTGACPVRARLATVVRFAFP